MCCCRLSQSLVDLHRFACVRMSLSGPCQRLRRLVLACHGCRLERVAMLIGGHWHYNIVFAEDEQTILERSVWRQRNPLLLGSASRERKLLCGQRRVLCVGLVIEGLLSLAKGLRVKLGRHCRLGRFFTEDFGLSDFALFFQKFNYNAKLKFSGHSFRLACLTANARGARIKTPSSHKFNSRPPF